MIDALALELELDRVQATLDAELAAHVRACAAAHARGVALPPAPALATRPSTLALARRAREVPALAGRAVALLRVVAPVVIEHDPEVARARAGERSWDGWRRLAAARDAAARARFAIGHVALVHRLAGAADVAPAVSAALPPPLEAWRARDATLDDVAIDEAWAAIVRASGAIPVGALDVVRATAARARYFAVERGARGHGVAVVPAVVDTPARRFEVLHELGHALLSLAASGEWPRAIDEAAASLAARAMEGGGVLHGRWRSEHAAAARRRRLDIARTLDAIERGTIAPPASLPAPPWALWHDPGAQAAYVRAEAIADELAALPPGDVVAALVARAAAIDATVVA